jgi:hypothetical protein
MSTRISTTATSTRRGSARARGRRAGAARFQQGQAGHRLDHRHRAPHEGRRQGAAAEKGPRDRREGQNRRTKVHLRRKQGAVPQVGGVQGGRDQRSRLARGRRAPDERGRPDLRPPGELAEHLVRPARHAEGHVRLALPLPLEVDRPGHRAAMFPDFARSSCAPRRPASTSISPPRTTTSSTSGCVSRGATAPAARSGSRTTPRS